jgi:HlyD family secretion protein
VANSAKGLGQSALQSSSQDATKFEVRIRVQETEVFRPGMSVNAEIETRSRTNVLCVPIASVTTRFPKDGKTNSASAGTNGVVVAASSTNAPTSNAKAEKKPKDVEVVFALDGDHAKMIAVKRGIGDDNYYEILEGIEEGREIVSGNFRAIRDLEDGKKIKKGTPDKGEEGEKK